MHSRYRGPFARKLERILLTALALPTAPACGGGEGGVSPPDASSGGATPAFDAASPPPPEASIDSAPDPCAPVVVDESAIDDAAAGCRLYAELPCGLPDAATVTACTLDPVTCSAACPTRFLYSCQLALPSCSNGGLAQDAAVIVDCTICAGGGRRPRGLCAARSASLATSAVGAYFAELAFLERASIRAFADLASALRAHHAPQSLVRAARRAQADERRHAVVTRRLARRFGGTCRPVVVTQVGVPSLPELLLHNVVEGCIGEAFGALMAMWQSVRSPDPDIAGSMRALARDEVRHAALSFRLLRWGAARVDGRTRALLREQCISSLAALERLLDQSAAEEVIEVAGHPSAPSARALFAAFAPAVLEDADAALVVAPGAATGLVAPPGEAVGLVMPPGEATASCSPASRGSRSRGRPPRVPRSAPHS